MSKEGILGKETILRVKKTLEIQRKMNCAILVTSGWAYREDTHLAIGEVVSDYIINNYDLNCKVLTDTNSRDTVGDAFFLRKRLNKYNISKLYVVTSDYHVKRAKLIFEAFFSKKINIRVVGVNTNLKSKKIINKKELQSIKAFNKTFFGVNLYCDNEVLNTLSEKHPFYNGSIYPKILI